MPAPEKASRTIACPCGGGALAVCCGSFLAGDAIPQTALELMRSRYTAYALRDEKYLRNTWYDSTRPTSRLLDDDEPIKWLALEIRSHQQESETAATVEFVARYKLQGRAHRLHEISRFTREDGRWFYLDGSFPEQKK